MKRESIRLGQIEIEFLLTSADTKGALAMFEFSVSPGAKVPIPHSHTDFDETIYGLEGSMTFTVGGSVIEVGPGDSCFIPRGVVHGFKNIHDSMARTLAVVTPAMIGPKFFKEVAELMSAGGPPDVEKLKLVYERHGLVPAMP